MGEKSRGNWNVEICLRDDCANRGKRCTCCLHFSEYRPPQELEAVDTTEPRR